MTQSNLIVVRSLQFFLTHGLTFGIDLEVLLSFSQKLFTTFAWVLFQEYGGSHIGNCYLCAVGFSLFLVLAISHTSGLSINFEPSDKFILAFAGSPLLECPVRPSLELILNDKVE